MENYNTLNDKILDAEVEFIKNITKGLGKVDTHFITDMVNGFISNNSIILSNVVRTIGNLNIKKGVERIERHLDFFNIVEPIIDSNFSEIVKSMINDCIFRIIPARVLGNCRPHQNDEANLAEGLRKAVRQDIL